MLQSKTLIHFRCHDCGMKYKTGSERAGTQVVCKVCDTIIVIPALKTSNRDTK